MLENIRLSFQGVWSHKMRSFLTMLGIIIGIASIIAIVSTIKGTNEQIKQNLVGAGNNTVDIKLMENNFEYYPDNYNIPTAIPILDETLKEELLAIPEIENVSYYLHRNYSDSLYYKNSQYTSMQLYGVDNNYFATCGYISIKGRTFVEDDFKNFRKVVVIDKDTASTIFPSEDPIGKTLEVNGEPFTVIGVVDKASTFKPVINNIEDYQQYMGSQQSTLYFPDAVWPIIYCYDERPNVVIKAVNTDSMSIAGQKAEDAINKFIGVSSTAPDAAAGSDTGNSEISSMDIAASDGSSSMGGASETYTYRGTDIMETAKNLQELSASTNQQLIWIASISLLVGGIGVMNIMLVSVTERTQEIGLKKAIGARKNRILAQFLTEAAVLTSLGGIIGIIAGIILAEVISKISSTPVAISVSAIVGSVLFSVIIGLIFGLLPSVKAANLNPIDALRHE